MVHSSEPILKLEEPKKQAVWQNDLVSNIACAILLTTIPALFCMSIDSPEIIPFVLTCPVIFMVIATIGSVKPGKGQMDSSCRRCGDTAGCGYYMAY